VRRSISGTRATEFSEMDYLHVDVFDYGIAIRRVLRDRSDPLTMFDDDMFLERFCFHNPSVIVLTTMLHDELSYPITSSHGIHIPPMKAKK